MDEAALKRVAASAGALWADATDLAGVLGSRAAPFIGHAAVSGVTFSAALAAVQVGAFFARVSCVTPVLAPLCGALGVAGASAAAGQASAALGRWTREGSHPLAHHSWAGRVHVEDVLLDGLLGCALFAASGGRFRSILPSDVRFVGALARESLPAAGSGYATDMQRVELRSIFRRHGCHHCGTRFGNVIADHQPPNKTVYGAARRAGLGRGLSSERRRQHRRRAGRRGGAEGCGGAAAGGAWPRRRSLARARARALSTPPQAASLNLAYPQVFARLFAPTKVKQRFFPECVSCSQLQSDAMRRNVKKLVLHFGGMQAYAYSGVLVGVRHYSAPATPMRGTSLERWFEDAKKRAEKQYGGGSATATWALPGLPAEPKSAGKKWW